MGLLRCLRLAVLAVGFVTLALVCLSSSVHRTKLHHVLQDVKVFNVSFNNKDPRVIDTLNMTFQVWSRNANKIMGVRIWHMRIAVIYNGHELGRAYVLPALIQPPRNITFLYAPMVMFNITLPSVEVASQLQADINLEVLPLRIIVKVRGTYAWVGGSWITKLSSGQLRSDDGCNIVVSLAKNESESSLKSGHCGWTVRFYSA